MELQKVTYIDLVTIIEAQNLNDIQDAIIDLEEWQTEAGAAIPQILANIAPSFSNSTSYSAGDCVIVLDKLYQFTADHPAGDWTGTDAAEVNVTSLLKEAVDSLSGGVDDLKSATDEQKEKSKKLEYNDVRLAEMLPADFYNTGKIIQYPSIDSDFDTLGVKIYTDKRNFYTDYHYSDHKNTGGQTWYLAPWGTNGNTGLTRESPKSRFSQITSQLSDGDTIVLLEGMYTRYLFQDATIAKSVNIIGEGNVVVTNADVNYVYSPVGDNTYSTNRSNVVSVLFKVDDMTYRPLGAVGSVDLCKSTPFSYYGDSSTVYVNLGGLAVPNNNNVFLNLNSGQHLINIEATNSDINVCLENIVAIGGALGTFVAKASADYDLTLHAFNCKFMGATTTLSVAHDAVSILGAKAYFDSCEASYARKDGFNYHQLSGKVPYGFEVNCIGKCNGYNWTDNSCNGSTIHDGGKIIRVNCLYHDNKGANVADVNEGTKSLNIRCVAFDSISDGDGSNADFALQQDGTTMWLDCCKAFGSTWSLVPLSNNAMYIHNTDYKTKSGGGTFDDTWNPYA